MADWHANGPSKVSIISFYVEVMSDSSIYIAHAVTLYLTRLYSLAASQMIANAAWKLGIVANTLL